MLDGVDAWWLLVWIGLRKEEDKLTCNVLVEDIIVVNGIVEDLFAVFVYH